MSKPFPILLGDDARFIPRKKGLTPEYFYLREPVSVTKLDRRYVGEVLYLAGDIATDNGVMIVGIGSEEIHVPYMQVPFNVSKLIGNYCILRSADVIGAEGLSAIPGPKVNSSILAVYDHLNKQRNFSLRGIFDKFCVTSNDSQSPALIKAAGLHDALLKLGAPLSREKVEQLVVNMDLDEKGGLDYEEFKQAVTQEPTQLENWASMLPLAGMLASSLPVSGNKGDQALRDFSRLRDEDIEIAVEAFTVGLRRLLGEEKAAMGQIFDNIDRKARAAMGLANGVSAVSKFKCFKMSTGKVADYHNGLSRRIGTPPNLEPNE